MITKIIPFPREYFQRKKQLPLSPLMISALLKACAKQKEGIPFGPGDMKGSFTSLITRGLIIRKDVIVPEHTESLWQVTTEAIKLLNTKGIKIPCQEL
jgi:hypothetical protein